VRSPQGDFDELYGTTELDGGRPITFADHVRVGSNPCRSTSTGCPTGRTFRSGCC
jgi:hypothetical protein